MLSNRAIERMLRIQSDQSILDCLAHTHVKFSDGEVTRHPDSKTSADVTYLLSQLFFMDNLKPHTAHTVSIIDQFKKETKARVSLNPIIYQNEECTQLTLTPVHNELSEAESCQQMLNQAALLHDFLTPLHVIQDLAKSVTSFQNKHEKVAVEKVYQAASLLKNQIKTVMDCNYIELGEFEPYPR